MQLQLRQYSGNASTASAHSVAPEEKQVKFQEVLDALVQHSFKAVDVEPTDEVTELLTMRREGDLHDVVRPTRTDSTQLLLQQSLTPHQVREFEQDADKAYAIRLCAAIYRERRTWCDNQRAKGLSTGRLSRGLGILVEDAKRGVDGRGASDRRLRGISWTEEGSTPRPRIRKRSAETEELASAAAAA
eukprot:537319-Prymnesium_polylepis.1